MRWILVEIRSRDPKFFFVRVDPLPQDFQAPALASMRNLDQLRRPLMPSKKSVYARRAPQKCNRQRRETDGLSVPGGRGFLGTP